MKLSECYSNKQKLHNDVSSSACQIPVNIQPFVYNIIYNHLCITESIGKKVFIIDGQDYFNSKFFMFTYT